MAICLVLLALGVQWTLRDVLAGVGFAFFFGAVGAAGYFGGFGPALLASVLSLPLAHFFVFGPATPLPLPNEAARIAILLAVSLCIGWAAGRKRRFDGERDRLLAKTQEAERTLRDGEKRFRTIITAAPIPILLHTVDGEMVAVNRAFTAITGYTVEDVRTSQRWLQLAYGLSADEAREHQRMEEAKLRAVAPYFKEERTIRTKSGEERAWVFHVSAPQPMPDGRLLTATMAVDVTDRKAAEEALRESESRVRRKLDSVLSPEGDPGELDLVDLIDASALQMLMNDFHAVAHIPMSILDVNGRVLVGVGWQDICTLYHRAQPQTALNCHESDTRLSAGLAQGECRLYKCKNNLWDIATPILVGRRHVGNIFSGQFFFDDEPVDVEYFRAQAHRYAFDEKEYLAALGRVPRLSRETVDRGMAFFVKLANVLSQLGYSNITLGRLLTERDRLTDSLRENRARLEAALASMTHSEERLNRAQEIAHLGSWELDLAKNELTWSDEAYRIFGLQPQEFGATYEAFLDRVHPEDRLAVDAAYRRSIREERDEYEIEHRVVRKHTGEILHVHEKCEHFRDADNRIVRSVGMVHDVTDRKRAEEALKAARISAEQAKAAAEEANSAKDRFLAVLSHELRTPLTPVLAAVSMLLRNACLDGDIRNSLEMVRRNVELEARLIDDLLDLTRIARGKIELDRRPVELDSVIQRAVEVCLPDIRARGLNFGVDAPDGPYAIEADAARLQQVFWNLLKNAVKFTSPGGCVGIRCYRDGAGHVVAEVNDSGEGIAPEFIDRLFNAFEQEEGRVSRQFGGLGLGLAICKSLVELHGGSIEAHSEGKGKGASFRVRLPLASISAVGSDADRPSSQDSALPLDRSEFSLLLVEDHGDTAELLRQLLEFEGYRVQTAGDLATALDLAARESFDLLISDLGLPDGSGADLMRRLRAQGHRMPGIALSGYGQPQDIQLSEASGFAAHVVKPVSVEQLIEVIARVSGGAV